MLLSPRPCDDHLDRVFAALSHKVRRSLLQRLSTGPANISELAKPFDMSLVAVSKHLKILERAGLLSRSIDGRIHHCTLRADALKDVQSWVENYRVFWEESLDALADYVEKSEHSDG